VSTPLLENILHQAEAVRAVAKHQLEAGQENLLRAAELMRSRKRILLSGMGASYFACLPSYYRLLQRGWDITAVETSELLYLLPSSLGVDTVTLLVSRSGESVEVIKLLPLLKQRYSAIVGIVNVPDSTLSSKADRTIVMNSPADQFAAIQTYTATLVVLALLEAAVFDELDTAQAELQTAVELLADFIPKCVKESERWQEFLEDDRPVYLLGRGPALGAVFEGVLLMHEVGKSPAVGMSVAQFRHGPVEVVDSSFRTIVIGTSATTARLDAALAEDLGKMGGQVRWVGPVVKGTRVMSLSSWPNDVPSRFSSMIETLPLQMAAYRKAEIRGFKPGEFRWAPLVTTSEAGFNIPETR
jgi:glucosamine--fructose-6-phosphate aminotransferase (isomerizing)